MQKLIVIAIIGLIGWHGYNKYQPNSAQPPRSIVQKEPARHTPFTLRRSNLLFTDDLLRGGYVAS